MVTDAIGKIEVLFMRGERVTLAFAEGRDVDTALVALRAALTDTRPTADLGEDGELERIEQIKTERKRYYDVEGDSVDVLLTDLRDRLILYREALVKARPLIEAHFECVERTEALAAIDALLSRSGDD